MKNRTKTITIKKGVYGGIQDVKQVIPTDVQFVMLTDFFEDRGGLHEGNVHYWGIIDAKHPFFRRHWDATMMHWRVDDLTNGLKVISLYDVGKIDEFETVSAEEMWKSHGINSLVVLQRKRGSNIIISAEKFINMKSLLHATSQTAALRSVYDADFKLPELLANLDTNIFKEDTTYKFGYDFKFNEEADAIWSEAVSKVVAAYTGQLEPDTKFNFDGDMSDAEFKERFNAMLNGVQFEKSE